ncbi:hypothetical protein A6A04_11565 [Paramagnetospirillum marisnigri]|uniref:Uncharacterized protein n=1 Tax=Paramagnetospirillum marisnigri TaxID=1285242 RepID=A0A178MX14_9PROT|nr:hypothetical protein A6A04_11565 [Paramagnetospirillum marisnigri]
MFFFVFIGFAIACVFEGSFFSREVRCKRLLEFDASRYEFLITPSFSKCCDDFLDQIHQKQMLRIHCCVPNCS